MNQFKLLLSDVLSMTEISFDEDTICHKLEFTNKNILICSFKGIDELEIIVTQNDSQLEYQEVLNNANKHKIFNT